MNKKSILHLITSAKNASPFDVNMALDAGYDCIMPYSKVCLDEVQDLTQDAIFSRSQSGLKQQALFFGGRDMHLALQMQQRACSAMFTPFEISTFADPSGAFTTAAAMLAKIEVYLKSNGSNLAQEKVAIFGASGNVGSTAALILASIGAQVSMIAHAGVEPMQLHTAQLSHTYKTILKVLDGSTDASKMATLNEVTIALCTAPAGVRVLELKHLSASNSLKIVADVNAVAPSGIEAVDTMLDGQLIADSHIAGFGALCIGQLKYATQHQLLKQMLQSDVPLHIDYHKAYELACTILKK